MIIAVILIGGSGHRFGGDIPKQFAKICGKDVFIHTAEVFQKNGAVDENATFEIGQHTNDLNEDGTPILFPTLSTTKNITFTCNAAYDKSSHYIRLTASVHSADC